MAAAPAGCKIPRSHSSPGGPRAAAHSSQPRAVGNEYRGRVPGTSTGNEYLAPSLRDAPERARRRRERGDEYLGKHVYRYAYGRVQRGSIVAYDLPVEFQTDSYMGLHERYTIDWGGGQCTSVNWDELAGLLSRPKKREDDPFRASLTAAQRVPPSEVDCALRAFNLATDSYLTTETFTALYVGKAHSGVMTGNNGGFFIDWRVLLHAFAQHGASSIGWDVRHGRFSPESRFAWEIGMARTPQDLLPLRRACAIGNIPHSGPGDTGHAVSIDPTSFRYSETTPADQRTFNTYDWVVVAKRPGYREVYPHGLPHPLNGFFPDSERRPDSVPTHTPMVVASWPPRYPPWLRPAGERGTAMKDSRCPEHRLRRAARCPLDLFEPGTQIVRSPYSGDPGDGGERMISCPDGGLVRTRIMTFSKAEDVWLTDPSDPAVTQEYTGSGYQSSRDRIESYADEPITGHSPWVQSWGGPTHIDLGKHFRWPRMPQNILDGRGRVKLYQWRAAPAGSRPIPVGALQPLGACEPNPVTSPVKAQQLARAPRASERGRPGTPGFPAIEYAPATGPALQVARVRGQYRDAVLDRMYPALTSGLTDGPSADECAQTTWADLHHEFSEAPDGVVTDAEARGLAEMQVTYAPRSGASVTQITRWNEHDLSHQYYPRVPSKTTRGVSVPFFCLDAVQRFTAWLLVNCKMADLGATRTALNNYYDSHGYGRPWQGPRLKRWEEAYRLARERIARTNGEKAAGLRENIQERGIQHLFDTAETAVGVDLARRFNALTQIIFFFRANTMGAMEREDDIFIDPHGGSIVFKVRALKGRHLAVPILKRLPSVSKEEKDRRIAEGLPKHYRHRYFDLLCRIKIERVDLNIYTNRLTAAGEINKYIEDLFPEDLLGLREGSFISSHSFRKTGAVAAARTLCEFFNAIMPWGHWKTVKSVMLYVADETFEVGPLSQELFDFMARLAHAEPGHRNPTL